MTNDHTERRAWQRPVAPHDDAHPCTNGCDDLDDVSAAIEATRVELQSFEHRLDESHVQLNRFEGRLAEGDARMGRIETMINVNNNSLAQNTADTAEILQIMNDTKTAFKMIGHLGMAIKWVAGIAVAIGSVWLIFRDLHK